jgi:hypothetical protein
VLVSALHSTNSVKSKYIILGLAVLINRIGKSDITVGVDGSLYRFHPRFKRTMERCMESLVHRDIKVR